MGKQAALLAVIIGGLTAALAALFLRVSFLPELASEQAEVIDRTLKLLFAVAAGIFALLVVFIVYSAVRFRRQAGDTADGPPMESNHWLVAAFLVVPAGLVIWSATFGALELRKIERPPSSGQGQLVVTVTSFQWAWRFHYPDSGVTSTELRLPLNRPVLLRLASEDVIHSFWVPELGPKRDAVPGMETELRVTPNRAGDYRVLCAELCGVGHTDMRAPVRVMEEGEFQSWLREQRR